MVSIAVVVHAMGRTAAWFRLQSPSRVVHAMRRTSSRRLSVLSAVQYSQDLVKALDSSKRPVPKDLRTISQVAAVQSMHLLYSPCIPAPRWPHSLAAFAIHVVSRKGPAGLSGSGYVLDTLLGWVQGVLSRDPPPSVVPAALDLAYSLCDLADGGEWGSINSCLRRIKRTALFG